MYRRSVTVNGEQITYNLSIKQIKSYNMRVRAGGEIYVSAPFGVTLASIDKFVTERVDFIRSAREKVAKQSERSPKFLDVNDGSIHSILGVPMRLRVTRGAKACVLMENREIVIVITGDDGAAKRQKMLYRAICELLCRTVRDITDRVYPLFECVGVRYPDISIRDMRTRWGSCNKEKRSITYSSELAGVEYELVEYVVMHEMCHLLYADHSADYYRELEARMPDWKSRKRRLNGKP